MCCTLETVSVTKWQALSWSVTLPGVVRKHSGVSTNTHRHGMAQSCSLTRRILLAVMLISACPGISMGPQSGPVTNGLCFLAVKSAAQSPGRFCLWVALLMQAKPRSPSHSRGWPGLLSSPHGLQCWLPHLFLLSIPDDSSLLTPKLHLCG